MFPSIGRCKWCGKKFEKRKAGRETLFCRIEHRRKFDGALRAFSLQQLAEGIISVDDLKSAAKRLWSRSSELALMADQKAMRSARESCNSAANRRNESRAGASSPLYMGALDAQLASEIAGNSESD